MGGEGRTRASIRLAKVSSARAAPFATALPRRGSKRAASNSFTIARAVWVPSLAVGAVLPRTAPEKELASELDEEEREKEDATSSESRVVERVR